MKALSIKQPWANAIIYGGKNIENRTWNTKFRGRFLVHASARVDRDAPEWVWQIVRLHSPDIPMLGGIIGTVEIIEVIDDSSSEWFKGPKGFVLSEPIPMPFMPCKGKLGFFDVEIPQANSDKV